MMQGKQAESRQNPAETHNHLEGWTSYALYEQADYKWLLDSHAWDGLSAACGLSRYSMLAQTATIEMKHSLITWHHRRIRDG